MGKFFEMLSGKKTYLVAIAGAIVQGLVFGGVLTQEAANPILGMLGFGAAAALRSAAAK